MSRLDGKAVIVTGAASGIGKASMQRILLDGGGVAGVDKAWGRQLGAETGAFSIHWVDVTDEAAVSSLMDEAAERYGRIDGVVHAAGIAGGGPVHMLDASSWQTISLCPEWTVGQVFAHITTAAMMTPPQFLLAFASAGSHPSLPMAASRGGHPHWPISSGSRLSQPRSRFHAGAYPFAVFSLSGRRRASRPPLKREGVSGVVLFPASTLADPPRRTMALGSGRQSESI